MSLSDKIKQINAEIDKLRKDLLMKPLKPFKKEDLEAAKLALQGLRAEIREMDSDLDYVSKSFKDSVNELSKQNTYLNDAKSSLKGISNISDKILQYRKGETSLSEKQLETLQKQAKAKFDSLKNDIKSGQLGKENTNEVKAALELEGLFNSEIEKTINYQKQVNKEIGLLGTGLGGAAKILSKMGFGDLSKPLQDAIDKTKNARLQQKLNNDEVKKLKKEYDGLGLHDLKKKKALRDQMASLSSQNKLLGEQTSKYKNIGKALKDQLTSANLLDYVYKSLIEAFGTSQKAIGGLAKGLGMSASRATVMRQEFGDIANLSMNANLTVKDLQESQLAVGQALGTNARLNKEDLETMTDLVKKTGLQHSELIGIEKLSLATGKNLDDNVEAALVGATAFASQNKLVVDNNRVLREVNKASSSLKLSLGGSVKELGKAVVQAQKFGINLEQAESIASSMLDFESSIEAELSAELLTGKNLNLERARQLALEGDIASAAGEVLKQLEGSEEFSKMNVIQQEAMAKAVGLTREQLASSLIEREALEAMSAREGESALQAYERLKASGKTEEELVKILGEKAAKQLEQQSAQEKFNNSIIKLKEIFVQVMDALAPVFDVLSSIAEVVLPAINFALMPVKIVFEAIGSSVQMIKDMFAGDIEPTFQNILGTALKLGGAIVAIVSTLKIYRAIQAGIAIQKRASLIAEAQGNSLSKTGAIMALIRGAWSSSGVIPFIGAGLAIAAIAGGMALINSQAKAEKVQDAAIDPKGGLIVSGPKGTYQGDPNDTVIMGTGIGKGKGKGKDKDKGKTTPQQGGGGGTINVDMTQTNALLQQLINIVQAGGTVTLDGQKVGEALKLSSFQTQ